MVKKTMKFLANDIQNLLNNINLEKTDLIYLSPFSTGIIFSWEEDLKIFKVIRKKSGILPTSMSGMFFSMDSYPLMKVKKIIDKLAIEFNSDRQFLIDIDFETQKRNQVVLCITDTEFGSQKINIKEVFNVPGMPDPMVKAYANNHDSKSHLRLAKCVAENGEVGIEFGGNRMKISGLSKEIFFGGVVMDYATHDDFWMPDLKISASAVSHILQFKDSSVCWAETEPGILTFLGDDGAVSTPYRESSEGTERQHLISNDRDGWVNVDRNLLIKQLEGVCSPTVLTESSAIMPIKSISQLEDGDILVETDEYTVKATATVADQIIQGIALLEFWGFPQKDSFYNNIIEMEIKGGNLYITGYDGRKKKINLRSNPNITGYWRGDGKKLLKILALLSEYDNKIQVVLDHPRLQVTTASGASILMLGCDLVDHPENVGENKTKFNYSEKPIVVFPDIEDEHSLDINELFTQKVLQLHELRYVIQRVDAWVDDIAVDNEQMEEICLLIDKVKILADFIPEGFDIPSLDECFDGDYYSYGHIKIQSNDPEEFLRQIDSLFCGLSEGVGKVMQCYCELPILMQYTF